VTLSLLYSEPDTGRVAVMTATALPAVGTHVPCIEAGIGGACTQGKITNPHIAPFLIEQLEAGADIEAAIEEVKAKDTEVESRQFMLINAKGESGCFIGKDNIEVSGSLKDTGLIVSGNMLASMSVLETMLTRFDVVHANASSNMAVMEHLITVLAASLQAGGDKRGTCSSVIRIVSPDQVPLEMRIDYSKQLIEDMKMLYEQMNQTAYVDLLKSMPIKGLKNESK
jgi:uncharacterized Ntn-hydrolase superfamily protein